MKLFLVILCCTVIVYGDNLDLLLNGIYWIVKTESFKKYVYRSGEPGVIQYSVVTMAKAITCIIQNLYSNFSTPVDIVMQGKQREFFGQVIQKII